MQSSAIFTYSGSMIFLVSLLMVAAGVHELWTSKLGKIGADLWSLSDGGRKLSIAAGKVAAALIAVAGVVLFVDGVTHGL